VSDEPLLSSGVPAFAMAWRQLLLDVRVSDGAVRMYLVLSTYTRPDRPVAYPGQEALATAMNCSVDTVQRRGAELVAAGWIDKIRRGKGRSNLYHLRMPGTTRPPVDKPVDEPVDAGVAEPLDTADLRLPETASVRLPYEEEPLEEETPQTPRKRGATRGRDRSPFRRPGPRPHP
jgi:hypothetical protein